MKKLSKKGISLIVSYTLLIIIAVSLSVLVYSYLKFYLPSEKISCPSGISLSVEKADCSITNEKLNLTVSNNGLFNITAFYARLGLEGRTIRLQINQGKEILPKPLVPTGTSTIYTYDISEVVDPSETDYIIEVQPAIFAERRLIPCEKKATRKITCS